MGEETGRRQTEAHTGNNGIYTRRKGKGCQEIPAVTLAVRSEHRLKSLAVRFTTKLGRGDLTSAGNRGRVQPHAQTYMVLAKGESDPVVAVAYTLLLDRLDITLLLEHLGVLGHVLRRLERVKVTNVGVSVEDGNKRRGDLAQRSEREGREERKSLDIREGGHPVFGVRNKP